MASTNQANYDSEMAEYNLLQEKNEALTEVYRVFKDDPNMKIEMSTDGNTRSINLIGRVPLLGHPPVRPKSTVVIEGITDGDPEAGLGVAVVGSDGSPDDHDSEMEDVLSVLLPVGMEGVDVVDLFAGGGGASLGGDENEEDSDSDSGSGSGSGSRVKTGKRGSSGGSCQPTKKRSGVAVETATMPEGFNAETAGKVIRLRSNCLAHAIVERNPQLHGKTVVFSVGPIAMNDKKHGTVLEGRVYNGSLVCRIVVPSEAGHNPHPDRYTIGDVIPTGNPAGWTANILNDEDYGDLLTNAFLNETANTIPFLRSKNGVENRKAIQTASEHKWAPYDHDPVVFPPPKSTDHRKEFEAEATEQFGEALALAFKNNEFVQGESAITVKFNKSIFTMGKTEGSILNKLKHLGTVRSQGEKVMFKMECVAARHLVQMVALAAEKDDVLAAYFAAYHNPENERSLWNLTESSRNKGGGEGKDRLLAVLERFRDAYYGDDAPKKYVKKPSYLVNRFLMPGLLLTYFPDLARVPADNLTSLSYEAVFVRNRFKLRDIAVKTFGRPAAMLAIKDA